MNPLNLITLYHKFQEDIKRGLCTSNGKLLAETAEDFALISEAYPTHFGSHPTYDIEINTMIRNTILEEGIDVDNIRNLSNSQLMDLIDDNELSASDILTEWISSKLN